MVREFDQITWVDAKQVLINFRWIETNLPSEMNERIRRLRTNELKEWREARIAALFSFGISSQVLKTPILLSKSEQRDFDFVMQWHKNNADHFFPVQLKELPPDDINSKVSVDDIYDKLEKYSGIQDLSVVIYISRRTRFEYPLWNREKKPSIKELWYLGCESEDQSRWFLYGSVLEKHPLKYDFRYPEGEPHVA